MRKNYIHPELEALNLNVLDVITASSALDKLNKEEATPTGNDPAMYDQIDL